MKRILTIMLTFIIAFSMTIPSGMAFAKAGEPVGMEPLKGCKKCGNVELLTYSEADPFVAATHHAYECKNCGDKGTEEHIYFRIYDPFPNLKENFEPSSGWFPADVHTCSTICQYCGSYYFESLASEHSKHTFKDGKCTVCDIEKTNLKVSGTSIKQVGKVKKQKKTIAGHWVNVTNDWPKWVPAEKYTQHTYKVKISWKKNSKAFGYAVTTYKPKKGDSSYDLVVTNQYTTKTSETLTLKEKKKKTKFTVYITPIDVNGFLGTPVKKTLKLKN